METPLSGQQSSLDTLRTVEFRQTLRGYHIDDVDEYLERVAVEAESLQEQLRLAGDRMRQAAERIQSLEAQLAGQPVDPAPREEIAEGPSADESLQKTLILAQKFVEQTQAEAEAQARSTVSEAETQARSLVAQAEDRVRKMTEEAENNLRQDVARLERMRSQLDSEVEALGEHLEAERARLRATLSDLVSWIDRQVLPVARESSQPRPETGSRVPASAPDPSEQFTATSAGDAEIANANANANANADADGDEDEDEDEGSGYATGSSAGSPGSRLLDAAAHEAGVHQQSLATVPASEPATNGLAY